MKDFLTLLLEQICINKENYDYFNGGSLDRILSLENRQKYVFNVKLKKILPVDIYLEFIKCVGNHFNDVKDVEVDIAASELGYVNEYYKYYLDQIKDDSFLMNSLREAEVYIENGNLTIKIDSILLENKFKNFEKGFLEFFNKCGFKNLEINFEIMTDGNDEAKELISKSLEIREDVLRIADKVENKPAIKTYQRKPQVTEDKPNVILGREIKDDVNIIKNLTHEENNVAIEAYLFDDVDVRATKTDWKIITLKITDYTDSMYAKLFMNNEDEFIRVSKQLKKGKWFLLRGGVKDDQYSKELVFNIRDINVLEKVVDVRTDAALEKRVELHTHTMMSQMDGLTGIDLGKHSIDIVDRAIKWGHKAVAITDHNGCQAFPIAYGAVSKYNKGKEEKDKFKVIYGTELTLIDDTVNIVIRPDDSKLFDNTYVVFDFETTGFNAGGGDSIIEVGAVKLLNGEIIDKFSELIDPGREIPEKITNVTGITTDMVKGKDNEETVIKRFIHWFQNFPMVAHNAKFDVSFLEMAYKKYNLGEFKNTVIDTLELSRTMDTTYARHSLSALVKRYNVEFDEDSHHRGDYDAEATAKIFHKMMQKLYDRKIRTLSSIPELVSKDEIYKFGRSYHVNLLVKNKTGLKNLFKIISLANTKYLYKTPRILRSEINRLREGILVGSGCYESEIFVEARSKSEEELIDLLKFYDYVEVQPLECYGHLVQMSDFANNNEIIENINKIIRVCDEAEVMVVATGDVHHMDREDKIYREIIVNQKVPGGGRHPLARGGITDIPSMHFRTTNEMLEDFSFLNEEKRKEIVITNTNKIADMVDIIDVIIDTGGIPFSPKIDKSVETVTELVYDKAEDWYGKPLPYNIEERIAKELYGDIVYSSIKDKLIRENCNDVENASYLELHDVILEGFDAVKKEVRENIKVQNPDMTDDDVEKSLKKNLGGIIGGGFDVIYLIAQKLVKKSNDDGYLVGSRGSVGSSFVATMMGITEVNPLPPHYRCPKCKKSVFHDESGTDFGSIYASGFDMPDFECPDCHIPMIKDGNDMPFATFLGFNADKVPDIDLNFSDLNQAATHEYTKVLFGEDNVYRAGTIGTVADKTAYGFVKGYCEDKGITKRSAEIERLAIGCTGVKRTTGQHPGGIVVIPGYMDVFDFTPFQYPADDVNAAWRTTHFDYHAIDQDVLKLDILGHTDPTQLRMIQDITGMDVTKVPFDDRDTMDIFLSPKPLGVTSEQIMCPTGTLGVPEFGTPFTIGMLVDTKPTTFAELIKISGLSHGTDVWLGNAQELIRNEVVPFKNVIGCRDDIMVYLMYHGLEPIKAFKIMEFVRKGKASKEPDAWAGFKETMKNAKIDDWFIDSCQKIKYMFPKAHAAAYVMSAFRIAYFKVHYPAVYYATYYSTRFTDFDIDVMIKGYDAIKNKMAEINDKGYEATNKELGVLETLKLALETTARGFKFGNIDLYKSHSEHFIIDEKDDHVLIPPFRSLDGLGDSVAIKIVEEREKGKFLSVEDLAKRAKVSTTLIDKLRIMGVLDGMDESSQMSLF
ncbi:MAG: PolC-type DNA polymerase III [Bacilli bacterium]|nr:PolC-type DNA polymerase III [Bacilli bacterium]